MGFSTSVRVAKIERCIFGKMTKSQKQYFGCSFAHPCRYGGSSVSAFMPEDALQKAIDPLTAWHVVVARLCSTHDGAIIAAF
jgi:hypothetical protein